MMGIWIVIIGLLLYLVVIQMHNNQKRKKLESEKQYLEQVLSEEKKQYQEIAQANKSLKHVNHDLQKYMNVVREIVNDEQDGKLTGDDVINRVLCQKEIEAKKKKIRFLSEKRQPVSLRLTNAEIIRLFTNLLDNAIEAAEKCEQERFVEIHIGVPGKEYRGDEGMQETDGRVHIEINNSKNPKEEPIVNGMATSKQDKEYHGYGMRIIREIVERYEGHIELEDCGDTFLVVVEV